MVHWKHSYAYGKKKEEVVLPIIKQYFGKVILSKSRAVC